AVEREAVAVGQLETLREHHLEDVARVDVVERLADRGLEGALAATERPGLRLSPDWPLGAGHADGEGLRRRPAQRVRPPYLHLDVPEDREHAASERLGPRGGILAGRDRPGAPLPVIEGNELRHVE